VSDGPQNDPPQALQRLTALVPPPPEPVEPAEEARWPEIEQALGTALPSDYKALLATYGSGTFDEELWLFSPFAPPGDGNLLDECPAVLADYAESRRRFPARYPLPPFPEPGGVLPLGRSDTGNELYWVTEGQPDDWPVALFGSRSPRHEVHPGGIAAFLAALAAGELDTRLLPEGLRRRDRHSFTPFD
jgi:hypothetical protein